MNIKPDNIKINLSISKSISDRDPKIVFIVKDIENDEPYVGSVSILRSTFLDGELDVTHRMWVTLFDDQADDEYDGAMGLNDEEDPRVLFEFTISAIAESDDEEIQSSIKLISRN
jgi:hypothetical protein